MLNKKALLVAALVIAVNGYHRKIADGTLKDGDMRAKIVAYEFLDAPKTKRGVHEKEEVDESDD